VSVDWSYEYSTISKRPSREPASFLQMLTREEVYSAEAPTLWDIDFRTAVSKPNSKTASAPVRITASPLDRADNAGTVDVDTTRPEMLASCVALVAHPDDERYSRCSDRSWSRALRRRVRSSPRTGRPGKRHRHRDDLHVRRYDRRGVVARIEPPTRALIGRDGRFLAADFADESLPVRDAELAQEFYDRDVLGKTVNQAARRSSTLCARPGH